MMRSNQEPDNDESLRRVLCHWRVDAPLPPRFQEQVWHRIARTETEQEGKLWARLMRLVQVVLPRPKIALAYVAALLVLGMTAGSVAAQVKSSHLDATLSARYVQSLNPYQGETEQP